MSRRIRWRIHLPVAPERVFDVLATDEGRARFWAETTREKEGFVEFTFPGGQTHRGRLLESRRPNRLALEYFGGVARFELEPDGTGGTDLELRHDDVPAAEWPETHAGWVSVLLSLKAALVFSIDLRNHDPRRSWEQGYVDQ